MHFLIDGHNLIGHLPGLDLDDPHDEEKLLAHLRRYRARTGHHLTVFFDPGSSYHPAETKNSGGVTVRFARRGQTADQLILRRLRKVINPQSFMLVTSDRAIRQAAQLAGVRLLTAQEFGQQLLQLSVETKPEEDEDYQADVQLSEDEVAEWLEIFKQRKK
jgi:predicted RNA-binding protein with PIN domain